jgi:hypothetical protein
MRTCLTSAWPIGAVAACLVCLAAAPTTEPSTRPAPRIIGSLKIETAGEWVAQTPLWTILTYQNPHPEEQPGPYLRVTPLTNPITAFRIIDYDLELVELATGIVQYRHDLPGPAWAPTTGRGPWEQPKALGVPGRGELTVFNCVPWAADMPTEGTFLLRITARVSVPPWNPIAGTNYHAGTAYTGTTATPVRIRPATAAELPLLGDFPALPRQYFIRRAAPAPPADPPASLLSAMGPLWLLRDLATRPIKTDVPGQDDPQKYSEWVDQVSEQQIRNMDAAKIGVGLPMFYDSLTNLLRFEILLCQGKDEEAAALRQRTLKDYPGLAWMFDQTAKEPVGGIIHTLRGDARATGALDRAPMK